MDDADSADRFVQAERDFAIAQRRPVPTRCECGNPCAFLTNGARARFCAECLVGFIAEVVPR